MALAHDDVLRVLQEIFEDLDDDLEIDPGEMTPETKLLDLGLESISLVYLISELQQHYAMGDRLFRKLRAEERLLKDMSVNDMVVAVVALSREDPA